MKTADGDVGDTGTGQAQRIVAAARRLVADRGIARSHVKDIARAAGFSPAIVSYYFAGGKNQVLAEVIDADAAARLERLRELVGEARTLDELVEGLALTLGDVMTAGEGGALAAHEFAVLASRDELVGLRQAAARRGYRDALAGILEDKQRAGLIVLRDDAHDVAAVLVALGQGLVGEAAADPDGDHDGAVRCAIGVVREMLAP